MGFVYKLIDPEHFYQGELYGIITVIPSISKFAMRVVIILMDLLTYYPAVILIVLDYMSTARKSIKIMTIFMFLNFPMYAVVEYRNTQINSPHMAFLLLTLYFTWKHKLEIATACFALCIAYKHYPGPYVLPIAAYMLWVIIDYARSLSKPVS
jgi:hypothetical protein